MAACQASLSISNSRNLLRLMSIESVILSNHLILCHPLLPCVQSFSASGSFLLHLRWPECCSFSFSIRPSNEYSGLISFRMDWFDLLAIQGTKSLLQHHDFKSIQNSSVLSLLDGPTLTSVHDHWKNHPFDYMDLCQQSDVSAFSLSQLIIAFLPRIKHLLISWLQSLSEVILEPRKIKCVTVSIFSPSICHEGMG